MNRRRMGGNSERERGDGIRIWDGRRLEFVVERQESCNRLGGGGELYFAGSSLNFWPMAVIPIVGEMPDVGAF